MSEYISCLDILSNIEDIQSGDVVYVVSDVLELAKVARANGESFKADLFLQTVIDKVGAEGTVLIPTFNWGFCRGIPFDSRTTPSQTGALGNAALKDPQFSRTMHPIYSFAVAGRLKEELCAIDSPDCFGEGTVFDYLYRIEAKALIIGLEALAGLTMMHYAEQAAGVSYRYLKEFSGSYTDQNGVTSCRTVTMYVRDLDIDPQENTSELSLWLEKFDIVRTRTFNGVPFRTALLRPVCDILKIDAEFNGSRNMYRFPEKMPQHTK